MECDSDIICGVIHDSETTRMLERDSDAPSGAEAAGIPGRPRPVPCRTRTDSRRDDPDAGDSEARQPRWSDTVTSRVARAAGRWGAGQVVHKGEATSPSAGEGDSEDIC